MSAKVAGIAITSAALAGLAGSVLTAHYMFMNYKPELDFYQHKHPYRVDGFGEPKGDLAFTYYYDGFMGGFNRVALSQIQELKRRGYVVRMREIHEWLAQLRHPEAEPLNDFAIVHPYFFSSFPAGLKFLAKRHRYIIAFEVADTTHISKDWCKWLNDENLDCVFVPSKFSFEAFTRSGVQNRVEVLPHGISENFAKPKEAFNTQNPILKAIRQDPRPKILFFCLIPNNRKGELFLYEALRRIRAKGRDFLLVIKTHSPTTGGWFNAKEKFPKIPLVQVDQWLSEEDLIYLYDSCDVYVHPYRGGAFELNVFEALARGLPVIVTGWGCVLEYCDFHTAYLIAPKEYVRVLPPFFGHVGWGVNPDIDHLVELLEFVLDNLDYCRKRAEKNRPLYVKQTWSTVIDQFIEKVEEIWETH